MPRAQQRVMTERRPARPHQAGEGTLITMEEIDQFLTRYETLDRA